MVGETNTNRRNDHHFYEENWLAQSLRAHLDLRWPEYYRRSTLMIRELLNSIPEGTSRGKFRGNTYLVSKSSHNEGRSIKLFGEEAGGDDFVSLNFYETSQGESLKPCEMPEAKVLTFLREYKPEGSL